MPPRGVRQRQIEHVDGMGQHTVSYILNKIFKYYNIVPGIPTIVGIAPVLATLLVFVNISLCSGGFLVSQIDHVLFGVALNLPYEF